MRRSYQTRTRKSTKNQATLQKNSEPAAVSAHAPQPHIASPQAGRNVTPEPRPVPNPPSFANRQRFTNSHGELRRFSARPSSDLAKSDDFL
jgi:hypothetical protein